MKTDVHIKRMKLLTTSQAALLIGIHENTVRRWSDRGILSPYRIGSRYDRRFDEEDIGALVRRLHQNGGDEREALKYPKQVSIS